MSKNALAKKMHAEKVRIGMEVAKAVKQEVSEDILKLTVIALNDEFGFGNERLRRLADRLYEVTKDWNEMAQDDEEYAREKVNQRIAQIFCDQPVEFKMRY